MEMFAAASPPRSRSSLPRSRRCPHRSRGPRLKAQRSPRGAPARTRCQPRPKSPGWRRRSPRCLSGSLAASPPQTVAASYLPNASGPVHSLSGPREPPSAAATRGAGVGQGGAGVAGVQSLPASLPPGGRHVPLRRAGNRAEGAHTGPAPGVVASHRPGGAGETASHREGLRAGRGGGRGGGAGGRGGRAGRGRRGGGAPRSLRGGCAPRRAWTSCCPQASWRLRTTWDSCRQSRGRA